MMTFVACVFSETDWAWCDIIFLETARDFHTSLRYPVVLKMVSEIDYSGKETFFFVKTESGLLSLERHHDYWI